MGRPTIDITDQQHQSLKELLGQRIAEGLAGDVSAKSIEAIVDEEFGVDARPTRLPPAVVEKLLDGLTKASQDMRLSADIRLRAVNALRLYEVAKQAKP